MSVLNNIFITMRTNLAQLVGRDENDGMHDGGSGAPLIENGGGNQQRGFVPSYGAVEFTDVQMVEGMSGRGWTTKLRPQPQQNLWTSGRKKMALVFSLCAFACLLVGYGGFGGFFPSGEGAPSTFLEMHALSRRILNEMASTTGAPKEEMEKKVLEELKKRHKVGNPKVNAKLFKLIAKLKEKKTVEEIANIIELSKWLEDEDDRWPEPTALQSKWRGLLQDAVESGFDTEGHVPKDLDEALGNGQWPEVKEEGRSVTEVWKNNQTEWLEKHPNPKVTALIAAALKKRKILIEEIAQAAKITDKKGKDQVHKELQGKATEFVWNILVQVRKQSGQSVKSAKSVLEIIAREFLKDLRLVPDVKENVEQENNFFWVKPQRDGVVHHFEHANKVIWDVLSEWVQEEESKSQKNPQLAAAAKAPVGKSPTKKDSALQQKKEKEGEDQLDNRSQKKPKSRKAPKQSETRPPWNKYFWKRGPLANRK